MSVIAVITDWKLADNVLARARLLARAMDLPVRVYRPVADRFEELNRYIGFDNYQAIRDALLDDNREKLDRLLAHDQDKGLVDWQPQLYRGVADFARDSSAELVVMAMDEHSVVGDLLHKPDDWHLLRESPCPVLFIAREPHPFRAVIAAVDALDESEDQQSLNARILDRARLMAEAMSLPLQVISVVPDPAYLYADMGASALLSDYHSRSEEATRQAQKRLLDRLGMSASDTRVEFGGVERVLEEAVAEGGLLVLGTIANKGWRGVFLGNTSERILSHVSGDMLVVN